MGNMVMGKRSTLKREMAVKAFCASKMLFSSTST